MKINDILNENDRREFMKKMGKTAAATAGALALGSIAVPSKAWPSSTVTFKVKESVQTSGIWYASMSSMAISFPLITAELVLITISRLEFAPGLRFTV